MKKMMNKKNNNKKTIIGGFGMFMFMYILKSIIFFRSRNLFKRF